MKSEVLVEKARALAAGLVEGLGMELVDVTYSSEHGRKVLRIYIDRPGGVTVDDCAGVSREFSTLLDVEDLIPESYTLEVSSPGLDRPLVKEKDFLRFAGRRAKIRTKEPIDGRRNFKAVIDGVEGSRVRVTDFDGKVFEIELDDIEKARLVIEI